MRANQRNQGARLEGLAQIGGRPAGASALGEDVIVCGDEDDRRRGALRREEIAKIEAAQASEVNVEDKAHRIAGHGAAEEILRGRERFRTNAVAPHCTRERSPERCIVIDDADPGLLLTYRHWGAGVLGCWQTTSDSRHSLGSFRR